jgi:gliding motility-associatede transport system auxiliary component
MNNFFNKIWASKFWWLLLLAIVIGINFIASIFHARFDLTKEKRYTLSKATRDLLRNLDEPVTIDVFLKGDFPAGFKKLANGVNEFLQECKEYGKENLQIHFIDPLKNLDDSSAQYFKDSVGYFFDITPYTIQAPGKVGDELTVKQILPGAILHYRDTSIGVNLLKGIRAYGTEP